MDMDTTYTREAQRSQIEGQLAAARVQLGARAYSHPVYRQLYAQYQLILGTTIADDDGTAIAGRGGVRPSR